MYHIDKDDSINSIDVSKTSKSDRKFESVTTFLSKRVIVIEILISINKDLRITANDEYIIVTRLVESRTSQAFRSKTQRSENEKENLSDYETY